MRTGAGKSHRPPEKVKRSDHRASLGQESTVDQVLYGRSTSPSHKAKHGGLTSLHPASHDAAGKAVKEMEILPGSSPSAPIGITPIHPPDPPWFFCQRRHLTADLHDGAPTPATHCPPLSPRVPLLTRADPPPIEQAGGATSRGPIRSRAV